jgi:hypothetical protein
MTLEIDPGPNLLEDTLLKETTKTPDMTNDQAAMDQPTDICRELDKTICKHHQPVLEATDLRIVLGSEVAPTDREMHSSRHSLHREQSIRTMAD